jgi:hypothetical protein
MIIDEVKKAGIVILGFFDLINKASCGVAQHEASVERSPSPSLDPGKS